MEDRPYLPVIDRDTKQEVTKLYDIIDPIVREEINAGYTLSFRTPSSQVASYLSHLLLIDVDGQYFKIARAQNIRDSKIDFKVEYEHVSYHLIDYPDEVEEYEDTPENIVRQILTGTPFELGHVANSDIIGVIYFRPSSKDARGKLIELARFLNYEMLWDNYEVNIVEGRGKIGSGINPLVFKLGENLIGVETDFDYRDIAPRYAYEVDVLDMGHLSEYEDLSSLELGDSVRIIDDLLHVDTVLRVLSYERNPFQKITPRIQVGNTFLDFFRPGDDLNDEDEEDKGFKLIDQIHMTGISYMEISLSSDEDEDGTGLKKEMCGRSGLPCRSMDLSPLTSVKNTGLFQLSMLKYMVVVHGLLSRL